MQDYTSLRRSSQGSPPARPPARPRAFHGEPTRCTALPAPSAPRPRSIFMGNIDVPTSGSQVVKMSIGTYEFGANLVTNKGNLMLGRITTDGRLTGRVK